MSEQSGLREKAVERGTFADLFFTIFKDVEDVSKGTLIAVIPGLMEQVKLDTQIKTIIDLLKAGVIREEDESDYELLVSVLLEKQYAWVMRGGSTSQWVLERFYTLRYCD